MASFDRLVFARLLAAVVVVIAGCRTESSSPAPRVVLPDATLATTRAIAATRSSTATTRAAAFGDQLEAILTRRRDTGARVSARFVDPKTGEELFAYDAGRPMVPASNLKLAVTAAALDFFGPDHVLETQLHVVGQDLWLVGIGDPAPGDAAIAQTFGRSQMSLFDDWATELAARRITSLAGNLYYVDGAFETRQTHPTWEADDLVERYAAPVGGLNLNDNCVDLIVTPAATPAGRPTVEIVPPTTASIVVINDAVNGEPQNVAVTRAADRNIFTISGRVNARTKLASRPVTDPGAFFADALRTNLATHGIRIAGSIIRRASMPAADPAAVSIALTPARTRLADVLRRANKDSQNLFAEATAKYLGRAFAKRADHDPSAAGSWTNADRAIRAFFADHQLDAAAFTLADGSGLSRDNRVSARLLTDVLVTMYRHARFETFKDSLAVAGVDGTANNRLTDVTGRVFCKTGYIGGVRSLSGYLTTDAGRTIAFSILYNDIPGSGIGATKPYEALQDEAVRLALSWPAGR